MRKTTTLAGIAVIAALALSGCASGDPLDSSGGAATGDSVIIGSADFTESQLVASIYSEALKAAGVKVAEQFNIGAREVYLKALEDGSIDLVPEYAGSLLKYFNPDSTASTTDDIVAELKTKMPDGVSLLETSEAQDKDSLTVTQALADKYKLKTISDLVPIAGELSVGGSPEWPGRVIGLKGLKDVYGLTFKEFVPLDAGGPLTMTALTSGQVQVADIFSTDPGIAANKLVALEDDKSLFGSENVVPVIKTAKSSALIEKTLNAISAKLTTADLVDLNGKAATGTNLSDIAKDWLKSAGLL